MVKEKTASELKKFGLTMAIVLLLLGILLVWRGKSLSLPILILSLGFSVLAFYAPHTLRSVEKYWMLFGEKMSIVVSFIVLVLTFYLVLTPLGLLMQLCGRDPMHKKFDRQAKTYWIPVDQQGPGSRFYTPY